MKIAVIGTGYVGLVAGACFAETGNSVICADVDVEKIALLCQGEIPIFEPGLKDIVERNQEHGRLTFTVDVPDAVARADVIIIAVGTPPDEDGSADLSHVLSVATTIGKHLSREAVIVTKSTVPVGTAELVKDAIAQHAQHPFHVVSNPEFLKEGAAVEDFLKPDRVVLGTESNFAREAMGELYAPFVRTGKPIIFMDVTSAEMTKYAANGMLATRISFMNEIAALCEATGADVDAVRRGLGSDTRIGPSFLFPGPGYGGSCFPKDVKALVQTGRRQGSPLSILDAVDSSNEQQKRRLAKMVRHALGEPSNLSLRSDEDNAGAGHGIKGAHIALWGLAFKAGTDDMREAPSLVLIEALLGSGATICAHDPAAMTEARRRLGNTIAFSDTAYEALVGADALVIVTDWNEYRNPDFSRVKAALSRPIVIDGRNLWDPQRMAGLGLWYYSIGRPHLHPQTEATCAASSSPA